MSSMVTNGMPGMDSHREAEKGGKVRRRREMREG